MECEALLADWQDRPGGLVSVFLRLQKALGSDGRTVFSFKARPGVSYSLRAALEGSGQSRPLYALVDIIDDDPSARWLSVCFYADTVTDPEERGNLIPEGILGEDGYCFDFYEEDEGLLAYLGERIREARGNGPYSGSTGRS